MCCDDPLNPACTFPSRRQGAIAPVQPVLRLPRDRVDLVTGALLALEERPPAGGPVPVRPGRLNDDPSQMCIAGLGNAATADPVAAGMLAGHRAAIAHQLRGPGKTRDLAEFGHDRGRGHLRDPTQGLQRLDRNPHRCGCLHRLVKRVLEPRQACGHMLDLVEIVPERRLVRRVGKPYALDPQEMPLGPGVHTGGPAPPVSQQKLSQAMARAQLVFLRRLSGTHHVSQRLVRGGGDPHRRQVTRAVAARQLQGIAPIRLHAIAGFHRHQGGCDSLAPHAERGQLPIEDIPRGARLGTRV